MLPAFLLSTDPALPQGLFATAPASGALPTEAPAPDGGFDAVLRALLPSPGPKSDAEEAETPDDAPLPETSGETVDNPLSVLMAPPGAAPQGQEVSTGDALAQRPLATRSGDAAPAQPSARVIETPNGNPPSGQTDAQPPTPDVPGSTPALAAAGKAPAPERVPMTTPQDAPTDVERSSPPLSDPKTLAAPAAAVAATARGVSDLVRPETPVRGRIADAVPAPANRSADVRPLSTTGVDAPMPEPPAPPVARVQPVTDRPTEPDPDPAAPLAANAQPSAPLPQMAQPPLAQAPAPMGPPILQTAQPGWDNALADTLARAAEQAASSPDGQSRVEIVLEPRALGMVRLRVEMIDGQAHVTLTTETAEAAQLLSGQDARLSEAMARAGVTLASQTTAQSPSPMGVASALGQSTGQGGGQNSGHPSGHGQTTGHPGESLASNPDTAPPVRPLPGQSGSRLNLIA